VSRLNVEISEIVEGCRDQNAAYLTSVFSEFPVKEGAVYEQRDGNNIWPASLGLYYAAVDICLARMGLEICFEPTGEYDFVTRGSERAIAHAFEVKGHGHRYSRSVLMQDFESESAMVPDPFYVLAACASSSDAIEHLYCIENGIDPFEFRRQQADYSGPCMRDHLFVLENMSVQDLYAEDPDHCKSLALMRALPGFGNLINYRDGLLDFVAPVVPDSDSLADTGYMKMIERIIKEREPYIPHNKMRLREAEAEIEYTIGMVGDGHRPYTLEELVVCTGSYLLDLVEKYPELNPATTPLKFGNPKMRVDALLMDMMLERPEDE
jgi:hypothetical protein